MKCITVHSYKLIFIYVSAHVFAYLYHVISPHEMIILAPEVESWNHLETWRVSTENAWNCWLFFCLTPQGGVFVGGGKCVCFFGGVLGWGPHNAGPMLKNRCWKPRYKLPVPNVICLPFVTLSKRQASSIDLEDQGLGVIWRRSLTSRPNKNRLEPWGDKGHYIYTLGVGLS